MSLFYIRLLFILLIFYNYASGLLKLPLCQCECCPGEQCRSQLLVFSVDKCNATTCSFDQCYKMYPRKCGLIPGVTNTSCNAINKTTIKPLSITVAPLHNSTPTNIILPIMIIMNVLAYLLLKLF
jgi:hypothetical protein